MSRSHFQKCQKIYIYHTLFFVLEKMELAGGRNFTKPQPLKESWSARMRIEKCPLGLTERTVTVQERFDMGHLRSLWRIKT